MVCDDEVDIIVELIGGTKFAKELVVKAISKGKHVVTANKALLAEYGNEIVKLSEKNKVNLGFGGRLLQVVSQL